MEWIKKVLGPAFYVGVAAALVAVWWLCGEQTGALGGRLIVAKLVRLAGDAALLTGALACMGRRWRWAAPALVAVVAMWSLGSLWYFRFWGDLPGLNSLLLVGNIGKELTASIVALWRWSDLAIVAIAGAVFGAYFGPCYEAVMKMRLSTFNKMAVMGSALGLFLLGQLVASHTVSSYHRSVGQNMSLAEATRYRLCNPVIVNNRNLASNGPIVHFLRSAWSAVEILSIHKELSDSDRRKIERFIAESPEFAPLPYSIIAANRNKNVILILVESLNAYAIDAMVDGEAVAPVMQSLSRQEGTLWLPEVITQVRTGGSGDGQLMANTGLHPLPSFSTAIALGGRNRFPSLVDALGRKSNVAIFGDDGRSWNEAETFASYGFDPTYTRADYPTLLDSLGGDGALLAFAQQTIPRLTQPFFLELLTVSMHVPFSDPQIPASALNPRISRSTSLPAIERDYLTMVNYFDTRLGLFIDHLRSAGLLDNTMIILMSDHSQSIATGGNSESNESAMHMTMMVVNSGLTARIDRPLGQIDLYPTILNLFSATGPANWRGAGTSALLIPSTTSPTPHDRQSRSISELILRTNYFATANPE